MPILSPWRQTKEEILVSLQTTRDGLSLSKARQRLARYGFNEIDLEKRRNWFDILVSQFKNPLVLILLAASVLSGFLGEAAGTTMIVVMIFLSALMGFFQEYKSEKALADLRKKVAHRTTVCRNGKLEEINSRELAPGDVVALSIGDIVPADLRLLETHELSVNEAALTGESFPAEKDTEVIKKEKVITQDCRNMVFMGTYLTGGSCAGVVVATGKETELGKTGKYLKNKEEETEFQRGIRSFGNFLIRVILYLVIFIFAVNAIFKHEFVESLLFALALAVGITPELLPIIITINLSRGAALMAKKQVITKRLMSIEDIGNADVLCTDKTGTLTEGKIVLSQYLDLDDKKSEKVLLYSLLCNSAVVNHEITGSPLDAALWIYARENKIDVSRVKKYQKLDELVFDFARRRMSVVVEKEGKRLMLCKGAAESVLEVCRGMTLNGEKQDLKKHKKAIEKKFTDLNAQGYRLLALAEKEVETKDDYTFVDEKDFNLLGFLIFVDKPKETAKAALKSLQQLGVEVKILTGDNALVTQHVCRQFDFAVSKIVSGEELENMNDGDFLEEVEAANVFVKITPEHKLRIIDALRLKKHTVAFLGDGINDAPALKAADVGISVDSAVDVAREAADIILLRKSLNVLSDAIKSGRETFGNTIKYIFNTISANYGNMFSVAGASLFLPFLPLLPSQIILNNLLSDVPNLAISTDKVDPEYLRKPKHWNIKVISRFMVFFGLVSSIFDFITFVLLLYVLKASVTLFRTGWFIESALSEIVIVFAIRTRRVFFKSRPGRLLFWVSLISAFACLAVIYLPLTQGLFEFQSLPLWAMGLITLILAAYFALVEIGKKYFYKKFDI